MTARYAIASLLALSLFAGPASAQTGVEVDVELVLAVDVSRSMTAHELEIQRHGYAAALTSAEVIDAIRRGFLGQIAIAYIEWAGVPSQRVVVDWTLIRDRADAEAFAGKLTAHFDVSLRRTSISAALDHVAPLFEDNGFTALRQVLDVSGDGPNNEGRPVVLARDAALARGIVINGLPLMTREGMGGHWNIEDLDRYYLNCVIGGPGAFVIPVLDWIDFPEAVRRKLVMELADADRTPPPNPYFQRASADAYDCLVGERIWDSMMGDMQ